MSNGKHEPREYTAISHDGGIVLCDKQTGAFLLLRFPEDLERLKKLLDTIEIKRERMMDFCDWIWEADLGVLNRLDREALIDNLEDGCDAALGRQIRALLYELHYEANREDYR